MGATVEFDSQSVGYLAVSTPTVPAKQKMRAGVWGRIPSAEGGGEAAQSALAGVQGAKPPGKNWHFVFVQLKKCIENVQSLKRYHK